jgi:hypothetical protein
MTEEDDEKISDYHFESEVEPIEYALNRIEAISSKIIGGYRTNDKLNRSK